MEQTRQTRKLTWEARLKTAASGCMALFGFSVLWTNLRPMLFEALPQDQAAFFTIGFAVIITWGLKLLLDQQRAEMEAAGTFTTEAERRP